MDMKHTAGLLIQLFPKACQDDACPARDESRVDELKFSVELMTNHMNV